MNFRISGTSVAVVGTYDIGGSCTATFALDGNSTSVNSPNVPAAQNHEQLFKSPLLSDGEHTLIYTLKSCTTNATTTSGLALWLDYILYTPSASSPENLKYFIDDNDPSISYTGSWVSSGDNEDFGHTKHGGKQGDSMTYVFNGTSISVHGRFGNSTAASQATFAIDGASPGSFSRPAQSQVSYNQELYISGDLPRGNHTLVVNPQGDTTFWIDYLLVEDTAEIPVSSSTPKGSHKNNQLSTITGAAIAAGCAVLAIALVLLYFYFKRWRHGRSSTPRIKASRSDLNLPHTWTNVNKHHQYPPASPGPSALSFSPSAKSTTPLVAKGSAYSSQAHIRSPSDIHSRTHHRNNTLPSTSRASSVSSERTYRQRVPVALAEEEVTYTLSGIQRSNPREDFPQSVHGHGDSMSDASSESRGRRHSRTSSSNRSNQPGSRSRLRNVSNPDNDYDSVAALKQRLAEQELMANYPGGNWGASGSGARSQTQPELRSQMSTSTSPYNSPMSGPSQLPQEEDPDSIAALKRRQHELVTGSGSTQNYDYSPNSSYQLQPDGRRIHVDSGIRIRPEDEMDDLPPEYTPR